MPRLTIRTDEMVEAILSRIGEGEPLAVICRDEGMPHPSTWLEWVKNDENLSIAYARARDAGHDVIAADCLEIADDGTNDWMEKKNEEGEVIGWTLNGEHVQRSKLRIETRLKLLAKWNPRKYGEKLDITSDDKPIGGGIADAAAATAALLAVARERREKDK